LGAKILAACEITGAALALGVQAIRDCPSAWRHRDRVIVQMTRAGYESLPIAAAMAFFTGLVLSLHSGIALRTFRAESEVARIVALTLVKEMGPILSGMLMAGRVGAAIAAELGTMSVNEEIDALHTLGINPVRFLVVPRFLALLIMLPVLVTYADIIGMLGGAFMAKVHFGVSYGYYYRTVMSVLAGKDILEGLVKGTLFGGIIAVIACLYGLNTRGGAEGVGKAITRAVVTSFVALFICDYLVTRLMNY
jgi:phospholipid/cholesterol/gamma-HCH transport system permease protein